MFDSEKIVNFSKNKKGDLVFEFHPHKISAYEVIKQTLTLLLIIFVPFFKFLDFLAERKKLLIVSVGLGIGFGLSVLITQRPDSLQAFPVLGVNRNTQVTIDSISIPSLNFFSTVTSGSMQDVFANVLEDELIHDQRSANLGEGKTIVISSVGAKNILTDLEKLTIGDEILVTGSNTAEYRYKVIEIRDMQAEYLPHVISAHENALILYTATNILRTQLYMVIAI